MCSSFSKTINQHRVTLLIHGKIFVCVPGNGAWELDVIVPHDLYPTDYIRIYDVAVMYFADPLPVGRHSFIGSIRIASPLDVLSGPRGREVCHDSFNPFRHYCVVAGPDGGSLPLVCMGRRKDKGEEEVAGTVMFTIYSCTSTRSGSRESGRR